jgi:hypothetical protein
MNLDKMEIPSNLLIFLNEINLGNVIDVKKFIIGKTFSVKNVKYLDL